MKKVLLMMVGTVAGVTNVMGEVSEVPVYPNSDNTLLWVIVGILVIGFLIYLFRGHQNPTNTGTPGNPNVTGNTNSAVAFPGSIAVSVNGVSGSATNPTVQINLGQQAASTSNCIPPITATQQVTVTPQPITFDVQTQTVVTSVTPVPPTTS